MEGKKLFGMPFRILGGIAVVVVVAVLTAGATIAYFSGTQDRDTSVATATIGVNSDGFPVNFTNLLPGDWKSQDISIMNQSTAKADLYIQLLGPVPEPVPHPNLCQPHQYLTLRIEDLDHGGYAYWDSICKLYPGQATSIIAKVADDVDPMAWRHYRIWVYLDTAAGNGYQNLTDTAKAHLIAVQYNGPSPVADTSSGAAWPSNDPNYGP